MWEHQLPNFYRKCPEAKEIIQSVGGIVSFCSKHLSSLRAQEVITPNDNSVKVLIRLKAIIGK